ncbi:MAG: dihydropteroate synthase [Pseudomonadota bacterium]
MTTRLPVVACDALPQALPADAKIYVKALPEAPASDGAVLPGACRLAGSGPTANRAEVLIRYADRIEQVVATLDGVSQWRSEIDDTHAAAMFRQLGRSTNQPDSFVGLSLDRPHIMGIINVTPDSFSDGGDALAPDDAAAQGRAQAEAGAAILDIGGESTRPGSDPVSTADEIRRIEPVVQALAGENALLSIDSRKADVMAAALDAGAGIVNDVSALTYDPASIELVAQRGVPVVLMHAQGDPRTMQTAPAYDHVSLDVFDYLEARIGVCLEHGIARSNICVDPGIGFGKTLDHNLTLMRDLPLFHGLGCPILLGASRKSLIERIAGKAAPKDRLAGSLALALAGLRAGVQILRVHDVPQTRQAVEVWQAVAGRGGIG